jgi:uncharacterized membrane protein YeaQ/YmgE (transglycosylase-associated protein family)
MHGTQERGQIRWLTVILAIAGIVILSLVYSFWTPAETNRFGQLIEAVIPSVIAVLLAIPVVYFVFEQKGIQLNGPTFTATDVNQLASAITEKLEITSSGKAPMRLPELRAFYETYRQVDWKSLLNDASQQIDIVVYYFDSWVNSNYDDIVQYFGKPGTKMRVFVADPEDEAVLSNVQRLFPEYRQEEIKGKIERTGERLAAALADAGGNSGRLEFYHVPHVLNYSIQTIDGKILVLSVFEMFRKRKIDSPAVVVDLQCSTQVVAFWQKELEGLLASSKQIALG